MSDISQATRRMSIKSAENRKSKNRLSKKFSLSRFGGKDVVVFLKFPVDKESIQCSPKDTIRSVIEKIENKRGIKLNIMTRRILYITDDVPVTLDSHVRNLKETNIKLEPPYIANSSSSTFGSTLEGMVNKTNGIPTPLVKCVEFLQRDRSLRTIGIFRLSGSREDVEKFIVRFNENPASVEFPANTDPCTASTIIKEYLKKLPISVIPEKFFEEMMNAGALADEDERISKLKVSVKNLPGAHYKVLRYLMEFLVRLCMFSDKNLVTPMNVSVVFGPLLFFDKYKKKTNIRVTKKYRMLYGKLIGQCFIENFGLIFGLDSSQTNRKSLAINSASNSLSLGDNQLRVDEMLTEKNKQEKKNKLKLFAKKIMDKGAQQLQEENINNEHVEDSDDSSSEILDDLEEEEDNNENKLVIESKPKGIVPKIDMNSVNDENNNTKDRIRTARLRAESIKGRTGLVGNTGYNPYTTRGKRLETDDLSPDFNKLSIQTEKPSSKKERNLLLKKEDESPTSPQVQLTGDSQLDSIQSTWKNLVSEWKDKYEKEKELLGQDKLKNQKELDSIEDELTVVQKELMEWQNKLNDIKTEIGDSKVDVQVGESEDESVITERKQLANEHEKEMKKLKRKYLLDLQSKGADITEVKL